MLHRNLLITAALSAATPLAFAHGIWIAERTDSPTIIYGHGAGDDAYNPEKITLVEVFDQQGKSKASSISKHDKNATIDVDDTPGSIVAVMDNGYWTKQADGTWVNQPKNAVENAASASHSIKTTLAVTDHGELPPIAELSAIPLLIMPQSDVIHSKLGEDIDVVVYYDGKPLPDAKLIGDYVGDSERVVATTDAEGKASVPVRNQGLNVIATSYKVDPPAAEQDKADKISYTATLSFVNEHHDH